jgi:uncharacterized protein DUF6328
MVLPGIQAVFGFQLIAIFNEQFSGIGVALKLTHLASLCLVVVAIALIMTPAAYDRIAEADHVSKRFLRRTAALLTIAMAVFGLSISSEMFVVVALVTDSLSAGIVASVVCATLFALLWFATPWLSRRAREGAPRSLEGT